MMRRIAPILLLFALLAACSQAPAPTTPLRVIGLSPAAGAADVPLDASVVVAFDGDVDETLLHDGVLALQAGSASVPGSLAYDDAANTLRFSPDTLLQAATTYSVVLSSDVRSPDGGELQLSSDWSFTTVAAEPAEPTDPDEPADPGDDPARDADEDGLPDVDDPDATNSDTDGDGLLDGEDPNPTNPDTDGDGLLDGEDPNPTNPDTDGDGLLDGEDPNPTNPDTDGDGLLDGEDPNPTNPDTDGDGLLDGEDPNPTNPDTDGDGLVDGEDPDPLDPDVDNDGIPDGEDVDVDVPGVVSVSPAPWSTAARSTDVRVRFDEPIDPATFDPGTIRVYSGFLPGLFEIWIGGSGIDGTFAYDEATQEAVFTPAAPLRADEWHWVVLDLNVADLAGNVFAGEGVWLFATDR